MVICITFTFSYFERNFTARHPDSEVMGHYNYHYIIIIIIIILVQDSVILAQL